MIRPMQQCIARRRMVVAATLLIQRVAIGFITRRRLATRLQLHRVESEMHLLQARFVRGRLPIIFLQAAVRGWLARNRKRQRKGSVLTSLPAPALRTDSDTSPR